jgi:hypothetical protein
MTAEQLIRVLEDFLSEAHNAVVIEDGAVVYDLASARYSVQGSGQKCVLHLWSDERNSVRRVVDAEAKDGVLRLSTLKFGQSRPAKLEICRDRDRRTPSAKKAARTAYQSKLKRILHREHPGWTLERITSDMDLERSFGAVYTRALLRKGQSAFAVLGVNAQEPPAAIHGALTFGILWLDHCRERQAGRCHVEGLKVFVPDGTAGIVRERMAHLDQGAAKWALFSLDESTEGLEELDVTDRGNIETHLVHAPDEPGVHARFSAAIARIRSLVPECDVAVISAAEISFCWRGLEFARAALGSAPGTYSFRNTERITFGTGPNETELNEDSEAQFVEVLQRVRQFRAPYAKVNPLWRMVPERWLESLVFKDVSALDDRLDPGCVYSQVPAFTAADRGMMDVLTCTRDGRLAIVELKADEDIHLPLQGVDYWARVVWHHARGEFQRFGYFTGRELSPASPLLLLVAPALRVHPTTDTLLRYIAREVPVELLGIDERWREGVRTVFRKRKEVRS